MSHFSNWFEQPTNTQVLPEKDLPKSPASKTYAAESVLNQFTDQCFDYEVEKQKMIEQLDRMKALSVKEFTLRKKYEELYDLDLNLFYESFRDAKAKIWSPSDINNEEQTVKEITELSPILRTAYSDEDKQIWTALRYCCSAAEFDQTPGRYIRFFMVDNNTDKILGIIAVSSDFAGLPPREKFIGCEKWEKKEKLKKIIPFWANGQTIVPTQPFGSLCLGGKLAAALIRSKVVRDEWSKDRESKTPTVLIGITTTSLYGKEGGTQYSSIPQWESLGHTAGKVALKPPEKIYQLWHDVIRRKHPDAYKKMMTQKEGVSGPVTNAKGKVIDAIFKEAGLKKSNYNHDYPRGVYCSIFYENGREFLLNGLPESQLILKPIFRGDDTKTMVDWWRPKAIKRYQKMKLENRLNGEKLFYKIDKSSYSDFEDGWEKFKAENL
jgi:hypothetical protein